MREYSMPALVQIPATANLADVVFRRAAEQPQAVVLRRPSGDSGGSGAYAGFGDWTDVTASQFKDDVITVAKGLVAAGIEPGDRVALMSRTRYEWTLIDYAIWTVGAITVPVYETSSDEQAEWILSDSGARACFVETTSYGDIIASIRDRVPGLSHLWQIDSDLDSLRAAGADVGDEVVTERAAAAGATDLATIIYTSGTTGRPKGMRTSCPTCATPSSARWPSSPGWRIPARCFSCRWRTCSPGSSRWAASRAGSCSGTART